MVQEPKLDSNPALQFLLHDYSKYHWVLVILGSISLLALTFIVKKYWKIFRSIDESIGKIAALFIASFSALNFSFMSLIVFGNFLNAIKPQRGFSEAIIALENNASSSKSGRLFDTYNAWVASGNSKIPPYLENIVDERLSWQLPKAIICSILFALLFIATKRLWNYVISTPSFHSKKKQKALLLSGVCLSIITTVLWIMAIANTQASIAPVTLSLLFS